MATFEKRTDQNGKITHRAKIRLKGHPVQSATFDRLTDAKKWAASTESAIREGRHFNINEAKKHTFEDAVDRYIKTALPTFRTREQANRTIHLSWWKNAIGHKLLSDLKPATFAECRDELAKKTTSTGKALAAATIKKYFLTLDDVLNQCHQEWSWLAQSPLKEKPIKLPSPAKGRTRYLDDDERERFINACKELSEQYPLLLPMIVIAISTGMRQSELRYLHWKKPGTAPKETAWGIVNLAEGNAMLYATKNTEPRKSHLTGQALIELKALAKLRRLDTHLVFPGTQNPKKPFDIRYAFEKAVNMAGITDFKWHDLRHCTASYLAMDGASLRDIADVTGHKTLSMVMRYAHLSEEHTNKVTASMNAKIFGNTL